MLRSTAGERSKRVFAFLGNSSLSEADDNNTGIVVPLAEKASEETFGLSVTDDALCAQQGI